MKDNENNTIQNNETEINFVNNSIYISNNINSQIKTNIQNFTNQIKIFLNFFNATIQQNKVNICLKHRDFYEEERLLFANNYADIVDSKITIKLDNSKCKALKEIFSNISKEYLDIYDGQENIVCLDFKIRNIEHLTTSLEENISRQKLQNIMLPLLLAREMSENNVLYKDNLPLEIFQYILFFCDLYQPKFIDIKTPDPIVKQAEPPKQTLTKPKNERQL